MDKFLIRNLIKEDDGRPTSCVSAISRLDSNAKQNPKLNSNNKEWDSKESLKPQVKRPCFEAIKFVRSDNFSIQNLLKTEGDSCVATSVPECRIHDSVHENVQKKTEPRETSAKYSCCDVTFPNSGVKIHQINARIIAAENLNLKYGRLFCKGMADYIYQRLEKEVEYFTGDLMKVRVYGKWHHIPRKQVSYGDPGLSYSFSGNCVPAVPWDNCKVVKELKKAVEYVCNQSFNFVLVNRYKDGLDHMGEHRDDEKDLVPGAPIASLSFGQTRDFIFKHKDSRGQRSQHKIDPVKLELQHGSILLMLHPTNVYWYHSLPIRRKAVNTRINLTFRDMVKKT